MPILSVNKVVILLVGTLNLGLLIWSRSLEKSVKNDRYVPAAASTYRITSKFAWLTDSDVLGFQKSLKTPQVYTLVNYITLCNYLQCISIKGFENCVGMDISFSSYNAYCSHTFVDFLTPIKFLNMGYRVDFKLS